jgi:hypothetical protein
VRRTYSVKWGQEANELNNAFNRYATEQGIGNTWLNYNSNEDQRYNNMLLSLAQLGMGADTNLSNAGLSTASQGAGYYDNYGNWIGQNAGNYSNQQNNLNNSYANSLVQMILGYGNATGENAWRVANPLATANLMQGNNQANLATGVGNTGMSLLQILANAGILK